MFAAAVIGCAESGTGPAAGSKPAEVAAPEQLANAAAPKTVAPDAGAAIADSTSETTAKVTEEVPAKVAPAEAVPKEIAKSEPEAKPERDPILKGLTFQGLDEQFSAIKKAYTESPENPDAVGQYLGIVEQLGILHSRQGSKDIANVAFERAGEILDKAVAAGVEVDKDLKGFVYYNNACVKSLAGHAEEAMSLVEKALQNGFSDLEQLRQDEDLAAVRDLPGFSEKFAEWEVAAKQQHIEHAKAELASAESFPFTFELTDVKGAPIKLADFQGKVCIVDIWGTWCPPCRAEIPSFIKLQETYGSQGFQMVGLNQERAPTPEEEAEKVVNYIEKNGMNYPCALITEEVMGQVPEFGGFPTTLFIDRTGKVRLKAVGLHDYAFLEAVVTELLAEDGAPLDAATPAEAAPAADETEKPAP
jgi:thiol-disulfide isomerase/thioredoxin